MMLRNPNIVELRRTRWEVFIYMAKKRRNRLICYIKPLSYKSEIPLKLQEPHCSEITRFLTFTKKTKNKGGVELNHFPSVKASDPTRVQHLDGFKPTHLEKNISGFGYIWIHFPKFWNPSERYVRRIWINFPQIFGMQKSKHVWKPAPTP